MPTYNITYTLQADEVVARSGDLSAVGATIDAAKMKLIQVIKRHEVNKAAIADKPTETVIED